MMRRFFALLVVSAATAALTLPCAAQSLNIDFGGVDVPSSTYGAAGQAGYWNSLLGVQGVTYALSGLDGLPIGATVRNVGGSEWLFTDEPGTSGDDQSLLDDYLVTYTPGLETCLFFDGLANGSYLVITYAWLPTPLQDSYVTVDQSSDGGMLVGGPWPGSLQEGITQSIHTAEVTNGSLCAHSGIPAGANTPIAALNGIQLVLLADPPLFIRGDLNADGTLAIVDAVFELGVLFAGVPAPACADVLDVDDDGLLTLGDPIALLTYLFGGGPPPAPPFPQCGVDPTDTDTLVCDVGQGCP